MPAFALSSRTRPGWRAALLCTVLLCIAVFLAACNRSEPKLPQAQGTPPAAPVEAKPASADFAIAAANAAPYQGQLAVALEFTQPLVGAQTFDDLLSVKDAKGAAVSGSWALDDDGKTLRFPYVQANQTYTVTVRGGLAAVDGRTVGNDVTREVFTGPLEPAVGFASQGSVLPARETRGIPVVSVNVAEVDVEFLRVRDKELSTFFAGYRNNERRSSYDLDADSGWWGRKGAPVGRIADSVYANRFVLGGTRNERTLTYLPIQNIAELAKPGLYFAVMKRAGSFTGEWETSYFFVSDIGLHTRAYREQLFVHAASLKSGAALSGVSLSILDAKGESVLDAQTDADGNALLNYRLTPDQVLVARSGEDVSLLPFNQPALDLSDFAVAGRRQEWFDVFAWSGRDLYRPGETVRVSALLRDSDGKPIPPQPVFLTLKQPDGRPWSQARLDPRELGYLEWTQEIPADAPTGRWQIEFRLDPAAKEANQALSLRIEEFLPERLKLDLASAQERLRAGDKLALDVQGDYLYGAPAAGNRFTARLTIANDAHPLGAHKDFFFGDPTLELPKDARDVVDEKLDDAGKLRREIDVLGDIKAQAPIAAMLSGSVYESGGRSVTRTLKRTVWPADALVGVRPLFDPKDGAGANTRVGFELIRANDKGELLAAQGLKLSLVRENRNYHWSYDKTSGWRFDYTRRFDTVETRDLATTAGQAVKVDLPVEWGGYRLEVLDPATGLTLRYPFTAGWSWDDENRGTEARPDKIKLALDKQHYRAGDTLKVTVTAPQAGTGLLLVESDRLLYTRPIAVRDATTFEIPVTADWERHDVYVSALVLRGGSAASKVTPARAVGAAHVSMDRTERKIAVEISAPAQAKPEQPLPVEIKAPALAGRTAYVTVSAVDVGILNITRFVRPDAVAWFFGQRRLGIDAYDLYGRLIESFDGALAKLRYGGDMAPSALPQARRPTAKVQTVDLFSGAVKLDAQGHAKLELPVPDFNGTLRVTGLVFGEDRYGGNDTETVVRAPLVAEVSTPRVLAPGDGATLTLDLSNFSGKERVFRVRVEADAPLRIADAARTQALADGAKKTLQFALSADEGMGVGKFRVSAESDELKLTREFEIAVRPAWPAVIRSSPQVLQPGTSLGLGSGAMEGLIADSVNASLSISALPPLPFATSVRGLLGYPYGCIEQTASRGYGVLVLDADNAKHLGITPLPDDARRRMIDNTISRISAMQVPSGHFSMWGGEGAVDTLLTPYIVEFLLDARDAGFAVPDSVLQKALKRINDDLLSGGHYYYAFDQADHLRFADQAWSAYVLARVQRAPLGTLRTLFDNERAKSITALPLVHLGIALSLSGDATRGRQALDEAFAKNVERPRYLGDYGSDLRDAALMVALTHRANLARPEYDESVVALGRELIAKKTGNRLWLSTQEQSAIARLGKALIARGDAKVGGTLNLGGANEAIAPAPIWSRSFDAAALRAGVRVAPDATAPLYVSEDVAGIPKAPPAADDSVVAIQRQWYALDGTPWDGGELKEGEGLIVGIRLESKETMRDALLIDLLPGGLEIENFNLTDAKQWADVVVDGVQIAERTYAADVKHEEFRDDRYVAALSLAQGQKAHVFYLVRAVSPGSYVVPPTTVEDMYRPQIRGVARSVPARVTVVQP
ncbi:MAG TPA: alpha-2-macroglobulin [Tahibacter sp.]|uniref:alpha-2-macroglobulin family protein n=1 Tax=Tahibacter sp. TaxID=2056211 RepID=UPI002BD7C7E7|nr:alpha-2-macroglobulin [Tahibacter sp.]HSX61887.1 alpha-2-macroglobulin [Tahibacter sp.]